MIVLFIGLITTFSTLFILFLKNSSPGPRPPTNKELHLFHPLTNTKINTQTLTQPSTLDLSIIIPAYNETTRLPLMLTETFTYLNQRSLNNPSFTYEVIVVDDGSADATTQTATQWAVKHSIHQMKLLTLEHNRGKGGAVTQVI